MSETKVLPTPHISARWDRSGDPYPAVIRVQMGDGSFQSYQRVIPRRDVMEAIENIRNMKKICVGYEAKEAGR